MSPSAPKLEVVDVSRAFGAFTALDRVSLHVNEGSVLALLGPSGSGKSTLLKIVGGHETPDGGDVLIDGVSMVGRPPNLIPTATVFQQYALFPHYDVFKNVAFGLRVRKEDKTTTRERVTKVLDTVGMAGFEGRDVMTLSGGERQRTAMARALAVQPQIMLMDEPLGALDRLIRVSMQRELRHLLHRLGITTIYVTHDQHEAFSLADQVAVIERGRIHQIGTPLEVYQEPADRFVAHFVGGTNFIEGVIVAASDHRITLEPTAGPRIEGRVRTGATVAVGDRATALIRPEDIQLHEGDVEGSVEARITEVDYVGDVTEYVVQIEDELRLTSKELGRPTFQSGSRIRARWDDDAPLILGHD